MSNTGRTPDTGPEARDARVSTALSAQTLTWSGSAAPGALVGLELNPNTGQGETFTIVANTADTITTDAADGDMTAVAATGHPFEILKTGHSVTLTGLSAGSAYHFRVTSTDRLGGGADRHDGDLNPSADVVFVAAGGTDNTAPVITAPPTVSSVTVTAAQIVWQTDEPGSSEVYLKSDSGAWTAVAADIRVLTFDALGYTVAQPGDINGSVASVPTGYTGTLLACDNTLRRWWVLMDDAGDLFDQAEAVSVNGHGGNTSAAAAVGTRLRAGGAPGWTQNALVGDKVNPDDNLTALYTIRANTADDIVVDGDIRAAADDGTLDTESFLLYDGTAQDGSPSAHHSLTLTGLTAETAYTFRVGSTDVAGNGPTVSGSYAFTTLAAAAPDTVAPLVSATPAAVAVGDTWATIGWQTDEPASGTVMFGLTTAYGGTATQTAYVTDHTLTLSALQSGQAYHFRVSSTDPSGNTSAASPDFTFTTLTGTDAAAPQIISAVTVSAITDTSAAVRWQTDEPGTGEVFWGATGGAWTDVQTDIRVLTFEAVGYNSPDAADLAEPALTSDGTGAGNLLSFDNARRIWWVHWTGGSFSSGETVTITDSAKTAVLTSDADTGTRLTAGGAGWTPNAFVGAMLNPDTGQRLLYSIRANTGDAIVVDGDITTAAADGALNDETFAVYDRRSTGSGASTDHSVTLTGLAAGQTYHLQVAATDLLGNGPEASATDNNPSASLSFESGTAPDTQAPIITGVASSAVTDNGAVIVWATDEPSNSTVEYGTTAAYGSVKNDGAMVTGHRIVLTGLAPATTYHFRVSATDGFENGPSTSGLDANPSADFEFTTAGGGDRTAPQITAAVTVAAVSDTTALIQWQTDEPASSEVQYGTASADWGSYTGTRTDSAMVTNHSVMLTGLTPSTGYRFRAGSSDISGNGPLTSDTDSNPSAEGSFFTLALGDHQAPVLTSAPTVLGISDTAAVIHWETDEPGNSVVAYGLTSAYGTVRSDSGLVTAHAVALGGLSPDTTYHLQVSSTDAFGNGPATSLADNNPSSDVTFTTLALADTTAPQIVSAVTVTGISNNSAVVLWETDEPASSVVQYGPSPAAWNGFTFTRTDSAMTITHGVTLTGLSSATTYYLRVGGSDASGNGPTTSLMDQNPSTVVSFTTTSASDTMAPQIVSPVGISTITENSATVQWQTDEPGNSIVHYGTISGNWVDVEAIRILTFAAAGYVDADGGDLGQGLSDGGAKSGTLLAYDNVQRKWWVQSTDAFASGEAVTMDGSAHGGTLSADGATGTRLTSGGATGLDPGRACRRQDQPGRHPGQPLRDRAEHGGHDHRRPGRDRHCCRWRSFLDLRCHPADCRRSDRSRHRPFRSFPGPDLLPASDVHRCGRKWRGSQRHRPEPIRGGLVSDDQRRHHRPPDQRCGHGRGGRHIGRRPVGHRRAGQRRGGFRDHRRHLGCGEHRHPGADLCRGRICRCRRRRS